MRISSLVSSVTCAANATRYVLTRSLLWLLLQTFAYAESLPALEPADSQTLHLAPGDEVSIVVEGQPDMSSRTVIARDGTLTAALVGRIQVAKLSLPEANAKIERALKDAQLLTNPHVLLALVQGQSGKISVLGQINKPGLFPIEASTSVLEILAAAGGPTADAADNIYIVRGSSSAKSERISVDLAGLTDPAKSLPSVQLQNGDVIFVPKAPEFYILGEVQSPNKYRLDTGMTVLEAIARAGGVTVRGSTNRIEIERRKANGKTATIDSKQSDLVSPNDVVRVKERIF